MFVNFCTIWKGIYFRFFRPVWTSDTLRFLFLRAILFKMTYLMAFEILSGRFLLFFAIFRDFVTKADKSSTLTVSLFIVRSFAGTYSQTLLNWKCFDRSVNITRLVGSSSGNFVLTNLFSSSLNSWKFIWRRPVRMSMSCAGISCLGKNMSLSTRWPELCP